MKRWLILVLGILLTLLLSYICFLNQQETIINDLVTQAQVIKKNPAFKDVHVKLKGEGFTLTRELVLLGTVSSKEDQALASSLLQDIKGVTKINNLLKVQALKTIIKEIKSVENIEIEDIPKEIIQEKNSSSEFNITKVIIEEQNISKGKSEENRTEFNSTQQDLGITIDTNLTKENNESNQSSCQEQLNDILFQKKIQFANNSSDLKKSSYQQLDQISTILKKCAKNHLFIIDGYSDNSGEPKYNLLLSKQRANKVKTYLLSKGIDKKSIKAFGHGEKNPLASNVTKEGREQNRRIEFTIKKLK